jgi:hypothetical protein
MFRFKGKSHNICPAFHIHLDIIQKRVHLPKCNKILFFRYHLTEKILFSWSCCGLHWKGISIYVFIEKELRGLSPKFLHSCVCERFIYSQDRSTYFSAAEYADRPRDYLNRTQKYECRICDRAVPFLEIYVSNFRYNIFTVWIVSDSLGNRLERIQPLFKGKASRDGYFFIGLYILISTFCVCADGFQDLSKAFNHPYNY